MKLFTIHSYRALLVAALACFIAGGLSAAESLETIDLCVEHKENPSAVDAATPRFSWKLKSDERGTMQTAYQIRVTDEAGEVVWDSGKVASDQSHLVSYAGQPLKSGARYFWQVKTWDSRNSESAWSEPAHWDAGILDPADWKATWIEPDDPAFIKRRVAPVFRSDFDLVKPVRKATAFVTAHGFYVAEINGQRVGDVQLAPGWTSYHKRLEYQQYDVTGLLREGGNAVGATVGQGWWRGHILAAAKPGTEKVAMMLNYPDFYGDAPALILQIDIEYEDGSRETVTTDAAWKWSSAETVADEIYDGETIDHRKRQEGWSQPGFDDSQWKPVRVADFGTDNLIGQYRQPTRKLRELKPQRIFNDTNGDLVVDFGEHIAGWERVSLRGSPGDTVRLVHGDVIDSEGNFDPYPNRRAKQTTTCILAGEGEETFEPQFTFYGFRYIKVEGYKGELEPDDITAFAVAADMPEAGSFACSDPLLTRFHDMARRTLRGNTVMIPTDNAGRNERMGWTDGICIPSGSYLFDGFAFYNNWLRDMAIDQRDDGLPPPVVPFVTPLTFNNESAGRSDLLVMGPHWLYQLDGDKEALREFYPAMRKWIDFCMENSENHLRAGESRWGDWLALRSNGKLIATDAPLLSQLYFVRVLDIMAEVAEDLGESDDAARFAEDARLAREAFAKRFVKADGSLDTKIPSQAAYMFTLAFDAAPPEHRDALRKRWIAMIEQSGYHPEVGVLGVQHYIPALARHGGADLVHKVLLQSDRPPSWTYMAKHEPSTAVWERWNGIRPEDGKFFHEPDAEGNRPAGNMSTYNQPHLADVAASFYSVLGGIRPAASGFKEILIAPAIPAQGGLDWVRTSHETPYGKIVSNWKRDGDRLTMEITVPPNTTATVHVPAASAETVTESGKPLAESDGVKFVKVENGRAVCELQSGSYVFEVKP